MDQWTCNQHVTTTYAGVFEDFCLFDYKEFEKQGKDTMICLSEGFLCLVLSSWAICLASLSLALWVVFRSSCIDAQAHRHTVMIMRLNSYLETVEFRCKYWTNSNCIWPFVPKWPFNLSLNKMVSWEDAGKSTNNSWCGRESLSLTQYCPHVATQWWHWQICDPNCLYILTDQLLTTAVAYIEVIEAMWKQWRNKWRTGEAGH